MKNITRSSFFAVFTLTASLVACTHSDSEQADDVQAEEDSGSATQAIVETWTNLGGTTNHSPLAVAFNNKLHVFSVGTDSRIYRKSTSDGESYSTWSELGGFASAGLAAAVHQSKLYVFSVGTDNVLYYRKSTNGVDFDGWVSLGGWTNTAVAAVSFNGTLHVFSKGGDNKIYRRTSTDGVSFTGWTLFGGVTNGAGPAAVVQQGKLYVFATGTNNAVYFQSSSDGVTFSAWQSLGASVTALSATSFAGDLHLFGIGNGDSEIYTHYMHDNYWRGWYDTNPQGVQTTKAVGAASFLNAMWVFARRSDGQIVYHSTPLYRLPFAGNGLWTVVNGNYDDPGDSHPENQYFGFDFAQYDQDAGLGADILAARAGTVVGLREDYNCNPCSPANSGNWIAIEHADGTVATYSHIKLNGVLVNVGDYVVQGQHIAEMGNTGNSGGPHVHFEIHEWWSAENVSGPSVPAYFCDGLHSVWRPRTSQALTPTACSL